MNLLCFALILVSVGAQIYRRDKPGFCPPNDGSGHCAELCTSDYSCPGNQKCCSNGCGGNSCDEPTAVDCSAEYCSRPTCSNPVRPSGQCCAVCLY
ncbi:waprin-Thr1-like [Dreissena polymorpha]|uniref:waprin-Thr1-like n=1 Tax=Dreissena polymorpha TaxID=45954 RepID=UPI002264CE2C|nr:waprin-Thr1-like [Dreissena polymorpha]